MHLICIVLVLCLTYVVSSLSVNDPCELPEDEKGICKHMEKCTYAQDLLKRRTFPRICGFEGKETIVCCKPEKTQQLYLKPGDLSFEKCREYYPELVFEPDYVLVPGGKPSLGKEFPHMAIIGFGEEDNKVWQCGGSLISETFVLTAAHCLLSTELGPAKFVRLGDLDILTDTDKAEPQDFTIKQSIAHPEYKRPSRYNDIALIELDRPINRTSFVSMACLDNEKQHNETQMIASGWGRTEFLGEPSSFLLKTKLDIVDQAQCDKSYTKVPKTELPNGILEDMHICAGGKPEQDTCQGDSGGPLQIYTQSRKPVFNIYNVVGVTSFGRACGISRTPGVYTRVYNYLSWIEQIIWPTSNGVAR